MKFGINKKVVSFLLVLSILVTALIMPVSAASAPQIFVAEGKTITLTQTEKNGIKTIVVDDGKETSTVQYDTKASKINVLTKNNENGKTTLNTAIDIKSAVASYQKIKTASPNVAVADVPDGTIISTATESILGYAYNVRKLTPQNRWWLNTYKYGSKIVYESPNNLSNLQWFRTSVNNMMLGEASVVASLGVAASGALMAVLTAGPSLGLSAIIGIVAGFGGAFSAGYAAYQAYMAKKDADYYFTCV